MCLHTHAQQKPCLSAYAYALISFESIGFVLICGRHLWFSLDWSYMEMRICISTSTYRQILRSSCFAFCTHMLVYVNVYIYFFCRIFFLTSISLHILVVVVVSSFCRHFCFSLKLVHHWASTIHSLFQLRYGRKKSCIVKSIRWWILHCNKINDVVECSLCR